MKEPSLTWRCSFTRPLKKHACTEQGIYKRRAGAAPTLTLLGPVLDEARPQPGSAASGSACGARASGACTKWAPRLCCGGGGPLRCRRRWRGARRRRAPGRRPGSGHAADGHLIDDGGAAGAGGAAAAGGADGGGAGRSHEVDCAPAIGPQLGPPAAPDAAAEAPDLAAEAAQGLAAAEEAAGALEEGPAGELMGSDRLETVGEAPWGGA